MNSIITSCKRDLLDIYKHAIDAVKPERLIRNCVSLDHDQLMVKDPMDPSVRPFVYDLKSTRLHVIGGGKCVLGMARGLAEIAKTSQTTNLFSLGCLSVPVSSRSLFERDVVTQDLLNYLDISVKFGSKNNLPDRDSVHATSYILEKISKASRIDKNDGVRSLFIVLLSGGGSACLTSPKYLSLEEKSEMIKQLVQRGANIVELNTVRACFSHVKGGNLSRHILKNNPDSQIVSLIMSDVIKDPIDIIASGPTYLSYCESGLHQSMRNIMEKYNIEVPSYTSEECLKTSFSIDSVQNIIIGNNQLALNSIRDRASQKGYATIVLGNDLSGTTNDLLKQILSRTDIKSERSLIVGAGESTVVKGPGESWGVGGRVQEIALDYMSHKLSNKSSPGDEQLIDIFMACSTDGQDGPTDVAACFASASEWYLNKNFSLNDVIHAKRVHDSYKFWTKFRPDWLVKTGPSGTNVMDLYMLMNIKGKDV